MLPGLAIIRLALDRRVRAPSQGEISITPVQSRSVHQIKGRLEANSAQPGTNRREALEAAHADIMKHIAQLLPVEYRGYWI